MYFQPRSHLGSEMELFRPLLHTCNLTQKGPEMSRSKLFFKYLGKIVKKINNIPGVRLAISRRDTSGQSRKVLE